MALTVNADSLEIGLHDLALFAIDSDGEQAEAAVVFEIEGPVGAPLVEITDPITGAAYLLGDSITFQGEASDLTTDPNDLSFQWSSNIAGPLTGAISADGQSVLLTTLDVGVHTITLEVTDTDSETGSDSIEVTVREEEVEAVAGDLVFSELMINPQVVDDDVGEWVELYNTASYAIDIGGYTFRDDDVDAFVLIGPLVVDGGDYVVLCAETDPSLNGGVPCDGWFLRDFQGNGLALANGPDEVVLARSDGLEIDWLHYDETWYTPAIAIGVHPTHLNGGDNDDPANWCPQTTPTPGGETGTPGTANDSC